MSVKFDYWPKADEWKQKTVEEYVKAREEYSRAYSNYLIDRMELLEAERDAAIQRVVELRADVARLTVELAELKGGESS